MILRDPTARPWSLLTVALAAAFLLAPTALAEYSSVEEPDTCYGHVAYVLPAEYFCDGNCETAKIVGIQTGCHTLADEDGS